MILNCRAANGANMTIVFSRSLRQQDERQVEVRKRPSPALTKDQRRKAMSHRLSDNVVRGNAKRTIASATNLGARTRWRAMTCLRAPSSADNGGLALIAVTHRRPSSLCLGCRHGYSSARP